MREMKEIPDCKYWSPLGAAEYDELLLHCTAEVLTYNAKDCPEWA